MRKAFSIGVLAVALSAVGFAISSRPQLAHACGVFLASSRPTGEGRPSLALEQTLIVFDAERHREHLVFEVVFDAPKTSFGFVVPTPSRPAVVSVAKSPFPELRRLTYDSSRLDRSSGWGPIGRLNQRHSVEVLETAKVGSFSALVLAAHDAHALADWLEGNHLVSSPAADVWLAHYVSMNFFFVAMRYDPPADATAGRATVETLRISFDTELAYYPYFEPDPPADSAVQDPRMLDLWYVSTQRSVPVALRQRGKASTWVRPFAEGHVREDVNSLVLGAMGDQSELFPEGQLLAQRFVDQKTSRVGFGDVVFVPAQPDPARLGERSVLTGVLDPAFARGPKP